MTPEGRGERYSESARSFDSNNTSMAMRKLKYESKIV